MILDNVLYHYMRIIRGQRKHVSKYLNIQLQMSYYNIPWGRDRVEGEHGRQMSIRFTCRGIIITNIGYYWLWWFMNGRYGYMTLCQAIGTQ